MIVSVSFILDYYHDNMWYWPWMYTKVQLKGICRTCFLILLRMLSYGAGKNGDGVILWQIIEYHEGLQ